MDEKTPKIFPAKLLLFGEYSVIHGADSLAIPYPRKHAVWSFDPHHQDKRLVAFLSFLKSQRDLDLNLDEFERQLGQGLFLKSTIPVGYGAGSSGSVVAAIYNRFCNHSSELKLEELKLVFAEMESFFHGSSSGLDPLVSYLNKALYIHNGKIFIKDLTLNSILPKLFLYDSSAARTTSALVAWYKAQRASKMFLENVSELMATLSSSMIQSLLNQNEELFALKFKSLSDLQLENLSPMFPDSISRDLERIAASTNGHFKLCGAGGGGYYLFYIPNFDQDKIPSDLVGAITSIV